MLDLHKVITVALLLVASPAFAAWTKISESTFTSATAGAPTTRSIAIPGSPAIGDTVIALIGSDSEGSACGPPYDIYIDTPNYFVIERGCQTATSNTQYTLAIKRFETTPDANIVYKLTGQTRMSAGILQVWRGCPDCILDVARTKAEDASTGLPNAPSITTTTAGTLVFAAGILDDDDAASGITAPSGYTNLLAKDTGQASTSEGATVMLSSKELATATSEDPGAYTGGSGNDGWAGLTFALRATGPLFPKLISEDTSTQTTSTTHTVDLPPSIVAGNNLVVVMSFIISGGADPVVAVPAGWTQQVDVACGVAGTTCWLWMGSRIADGSEGATLSVTTTANTSSAHVSGQTTGTLGTLASATGSGHTNPPNANPGVADDYMWLVGGATSIYTSIFPPAGYVTAIANNSNGSGSNVARSALSWRKLNASSEDPGTFHDVAGASFGAFTWASDAPPVSGRRRSNIISQREKVQRFVDFAENPTNWFLSRAAFAVTIP